jgi:hypothetical protein
MLNFIGKFLYLKIFHVCLDFVVWYQLNMLYSIAIILKASPSKYN